ncbi:MAG: hypothetical protein D6702_03800 [Planctomycetota bacterium]|nr:MAG: hypothetical protein D6702_03800 [Planctomycetota bacterium]
MGVQDFWFAAFAALVVGLGLWWSWKQARIRGEEYRAFAAEHGWTYIQKRDRGLARTHRALDRLRVGSNRYGYDHAWGEWGGYPAESFNFHYQTGSGKSTHHHYLSVVMIRLEREFPELRIHPEGIFQKIGQAIGFQDIDFESVEFSKRFEVKCRNKKFAYDFCHTRMMEYLLRHPETAIELEGRVLVSYGRGNLRASELPARLEALLEIRRLMPEYLFRD